MVIDLSSRHLKKEDSLAKTERDCMLVGVELWSYKDLVHALENGLIPLAEKNVYMPIKLPTYNIPRVAPVNFYKVQLLGYIPIIVEVEKNAHMKSSPSILQNFIAKGALVQINASSVTGEQGKSLQRYAIKL